jgi:hypothetical protein
MAMPSRSTSIAVTSTSIWGVVDMLGRTTPGTGLAVSAGDVMLAPCRSTPPRVPPKRFPLPALWTPSLLPVTPPGSTP